LLGVALMVRPFMLAEEGRRIRCGLASEPKWQGQQGRRRGPVMLAEPQIGFV
jgi:hypothetical protein